MKRLKLERVVHAIESLQLVGLTRPGQWLPGFLCLKSRGLRVGHPVDVGGKDYADFMQQYYSVAAPPMRKKPFFDPLQTPPWKNSNWPLGTFHSRNDRSLLVAQNLLRVSTQAPVRNYDLLAGYEAELSKYFETDRRIPKLDFCCWMFRNRPFDDGVRAADLLSELTSTLNLTAAEESALFALPSEDETTEDIFVDEDWAPEELTSRLPSPSEGDEPDDSTVGSVSVAPPHLTDDTFVRAICSHLRDVENFEVQESFVRSVLAAMRVERFVVLCGKPGTGKTEFVGALHRALSQVLAGTGKAHFTQFEVHPETTEWDIVGSRDLSGQYVPSALMTAITTTGTDDDIHLVLLDEMNRGLVDAYAGRFIAAIANGVPINLPGKISAAGFPADGRWEPRPGVILFGAINSPLTEPARIPLSGPVKRRAHLIPMPDLLDDLVKRDDGKSLEAFREICTKRLLPQLQYRLIRRGEVEAFDGDLGDRLASSPSPEVLDKLWSVVAVLAGRIEIAVTLGVVQNMLAFILATGKVGDLESLDQAILGKLIPHIQGEADMLDTVENVLGADLPMSKRAIVELRSMAELNGERVSPIY